ncbi:hypothetical protein ACR2Q2_21175 [Pectobacterium versatile]|uniref:Uncharacterized protein n=1 Tax=Pectobacterium versatile TaxID=2488639 RepID=A0ABU8K5H1_9GAMM|nr:MULTISPECIES: hypothetical protein [Pectobacterium]
MPLRGAIGVHAPFEPPVTRSRRGTGFRGIHAAHSVFMFTAA